MTAAVSPHTLTIGATVLPYTVRHSAKAVHKRIVATPTGVEVVAPLGTAMDGPDGVRAYVHAKRRWIFDAARELAEQHQRLLTQTYASGAKLQYRGRHLMLDVQPDDVDAVQIRCRSKLHVAVPRHLEDLAKLEAVRAAFDAWLRERALLDLHRLGRQHQAALGVSATALRLGDAKHRWGSCGRDGVLRVHWRLIQAPAAAMDYVVAHEVAHLIERNHSPEFWRLVGRALPDWEERKAMLEAWEVEHRGV